MAAYDAAVCPLLCDGRLPPHARYRLRRQADKAKMSQVARPLLCAPFWPGLACLREVKFNPSVRREQDG